MTRALLLAPTLLDANGTDGVLSTATRSLMTWAFSRISCCRVAPRSTAPETQRSTASSATAPPTCSPGSAGPTRSSAAAATTSSSARRRATTSRARPGTITFVYQVQADSLAGATCDIIMDFDDVGNDRINLAGVFGPALVYRGAAAFNGVGQVRINDIAGPDLIVEVNLSGNTAPEMQIYLQGTTLAMMGVDDFLL